MTLSLDTPTTRNPAVTLERVGDDAILFDRERGQVHVVNATAASVWELCGAEATIDDVAKAFAESYDVPVTAVEDDVQGILSAFRELALLR
jgi:PqqD family protein of HPr-rel-A system